MSAEALLILYARNRVKTAHSVSRNIQTDKCFSLCMKSSQPGAPDLAKVEQQIQSLVRERPSGASLVGISGIDGSGKGYVLKLLRELLEATGEIRVAAIGADAWLNLPSIRLSTHEPARHFYENAFRWERLFNELVVPLKTKRHVRVQVDTVTETATEFEPQTYAFDGVDVILLEGIFLFKVAHRPLFDLSVWIDCTFETALERAIARSQEGLGAEETRHAYETIYFPAQRLHFDLDQPRQWAAIRVANDFRLTSPHGSVGTRD